MTRSSEGGQDRSLHEPLHGAFDAGLAAAHSLFAPVVKTRSGDLHGYIADLASAYEPMAAYHEMARAAALLSRTAELDACSLRLGAEPLVRGRLQPGLRLFIRCTPQSLRLAAELAGLNDDQSTQLVLVLPRWTWISPPPELRTELAVVRRQGVQCAITDYGSGGAVGDSISPMEVDYILLSPVLADEIATRDHDRRALSVLVRLCRETGSEVVATGVHDEMTRSTFLEIGCAYVQGPAIGQPGPPFPPIRCRRLN